MLSGMSVMVLLLHRDDGDAVRGEGEGEVGGKWAVSNLLTFHLH